jgi:hypothetical protein
MVSVARRCEMRTIRLTLAIGLFLLFVLPVAGQDMLTVRVPNATGRPGATVEVPIEVEEAANLGAMHIELSYDAGVLQAAEVKQGPLAENAMLESDLSAPGRVVIGLIDATGMSGDGAVAVVVFQVIGQEGDNSPLTLENLAAHDATSMDVLVVEGTSGVFRVMVPPTPIPPPPPPPSQSMTWLYLLLLLVAVGILVAAAAIYFHSQPAPSPPAPSPPVAPPRALASLHLRQGQAQPRRIELRQAVTTIGRDRHNHVVVEDTLVSRRHCQIRRRGREFILEDLASVNGTFLNGQRVTQERLRSGDVVRVGQTELVFR